MPHTHAGAQDRVPDCAETSGLETADLRVAVCPCTLPVIEICGEIDVQCAPELREELLRVIRRRGPQLVLDLGGVTFMDCAGIGVLVAARRRAQLEGGWMRIVQASPAARRTISLLGLDTVFALEAPGRGFGADQTPLSTGRGIADVGC